MDRRKFLKNGGLLSLATFMPYQLVWANTYSFDITFIVASDTHFDEPPETDQYMQVQAINKVAGNIKWPEMINA